MEWDSTLPAEDTQRRPPPPSHYPGRGTIADPYLVDWDLGDPENPYNWPTRRKWLITSQVSSESSPLSGLNSEHQVTASARDMDRIILQLILQRRNGVPQTRHTDVRGGGRFRYIALRTWIWMWVCAFTLQLFLAFGCVY